MSASNSLLSNQCPLRAASLSHPNHFFLDGADRWTYLELDQYAEQLKNQLASYPKQSVFAIQNFEPSFFCAVLFAALRNEQILFPINPKIPEKTLNHFLTNAHVSQFFKKSVPFSSKQKSSQRICVNEKGPFTYLLTSGSSSTPKICVHSYENHFYSAKGSNTFLSYKSKDCWLLSLPLYHVSGLSLIFRTLLAKATLYIPKISIEEALCHQKITHISMIPTQLQRLINLKTLKSLKCILLGGAPISQKLLEKGKELPIYTTYGLTEMSSQVTTALPKTQMSLLPYRELKIDINQEICVRGKTLFLGYLEKKGIQRKVDHEGYFATKDLGSFSNEQFEYLGRKDRLFISGGENIQPEEIERILLQNQFIEEAVVVPIPDEEFGERPVAFIKSHQIDTASLELFLSLFLPKYKWPIAYFPLEYSGLKPNRKKLQDQAKKLFAKI